MTLFQQSLLEAGAVFDVFDAAAIGAGIDLKISKPFSGASPANPDVHPKAYQQGDLFLPRNIMFTGGALDVTRADGTAVTLPDWMADKPIVIGPATVVGTSTATGLFVLW